MAKYIIIAGAVIMIAGTLLYFFPGIFRWFGRLPGDINIVNENSRVFIPITTMLLVSIVASLVLYVIRKIL
ncbi:MAG: DUF2905 domain-containing protein [Ferruginibacter sp.]